MISLGSVVLLGGTRDLVRAIKSRWWPHVEGVVIASSIVKDPRTVTNMQPTRFALLAAIRYDYSVNGLPRTGDQVRFVNQGTSDVKALVARYPVGKAVKVFYSPSDANISVLEPGTNVFQLLYVPAALAFMAAGIAMIMKGHK